MFKAFRGWLGIAVLAIGGGAAGGTLDHIAAIGASATDGFGAKIEFSVDGQLRRAPVNLGDAIRACLNDAGATVDVFGDPLFFASPMEIGPALAERAESRHPTCIVALDFVFWFGYGANDKNGAPIADESARMALLEEGLKLIGRFECPVVIGDFPDMSQAVGLMLVENQVPKPETLNALNKRLHEWAKDRASVRVAPLAELIGAMNRNQEVQIGSCKWPAGSRETLLQWDRLHPTADGLICLATLALHELESLEPESAGGTHLDIDPKAAKEKLTATIGERLKPRPAADPTPAATQPEAKDREPLPASVGH